MAEDSEMPTTVVCERWRHFNDREWAKARELLHEDFEAYWPQSRELIKGPDNFIRLNREYPGTHKIQITHNSMHHLDRWDFIHHVATEVFIKSKMPDGKEQSVYGISFFEIDDEGLILRAREYWGDTYAAPEWRKHLVEIL